MMKILITAHNQIENVISCIQSLTDSHGVDPRSIVIIDNCSRDGLRTCLEDQQAIDYVICDDKQETYASILSVVVKEFLEDEDLLILNPETTLPMGILEKMQTELSSAEEVGAVAITGADSGENGDFLRQEMLFFPEEGVLLKNEMLKSVGVDEEILLPQNTVADISISGLRRGYRFFEIKSKDIFEIKKDDRYFIPENAEKNDRTRMGRKWGIEDIGQKANAELLDSIKNDSDAELSILEIGCGCGANLLYIKNRFPKARLYGIESNSSAATIARLFAEIQTGTIENTADNNSLLNKKFDYIIFDNSLENMRDPERIIEFFRTKLSPDGEILSAITNAMYIGSLSTLVNGLLPKNDEGGVYKTGGASFTYYEILKFFCIRGYYIKSLIAIDGDDLDEEFLEGIMNTTTTGEEFMYKARQYHITAGLDEDGSKGCAQLANMLNEINNRRNIKDFSSYAKKAGTGYKRRKSLNPFKGKGVIYTVLTGRYEDLCDPLYVDDRYDYICFTDDIELKSDIWEIKIIDADLGLDKVRLSRRPKMLAHQYLSEYDYSIYIDAKVQIVGDLYSYIEKYSRGRSMLCFPHYIRDCTYEEAYVCMKLGKDNAEVIKKQIAKYEKEGMPRHYGMIDAACMVRNHHDELLCKVMEDWWQEYIKNSKRDQISIEYVCWKNDFHYDLCDLFTYKNEYIHGKGL